MKSFNELTKIKIFGGSNMNKKLIALTTSLLIGGTLLGTTAFASSNDTSGYEAYKTALFNMHNVKSLTDTMTVTTTDNGKSLLSANVTMKLNKDAKSASGDINIQAGDEIKKFDVYRQNDRTITKEGDNDVYNIIQLPNGQAKLQERKPDEKQIESRIHNIENIVDAVIGSRKSYFVLTDNKDASKSVNVKLSENQILPAVNVIAAAALRNGESQAANEGSANDKIKLQLPKLDKDIRITSVDVTAVIDKNGTLKSQKGTLTISGKDSSGEEHALTLDIDMNITNVNSTAPDTVNLEGKKVKTVTPAEFKHHR